MKLLAIKSNDVLLLKIYICFQNDLGYLNRARVLNSLNNPFACLEKSNLIYSN